MTRQVFSLRTGSDLAPAAWREEEAESALLQQVAAAYSDRNDGAVTSVSEKHDEQPNRQHQKKTS